MNRIAFCVLTLALLHCAPSFAAGIELQTPGSSIHLPDNEESTSRQERDPNTFILNQALERENSPKIFTLRNTKGSNRGGCSKLIQNGEVTNIQRDYLSYIMIVASNPERVLFNSYEGENANQHENENLSPEETYGCSVCMYGESRQTTIEPFQRRIEYTSGGSTRYESSEEIFSEIRRKRAWNDKRSSSYSIKCITRKKAKGKSITLEDMREHLGDIVTLKYVK